MTIGCRWIERYDALENMRVLLPYVVECLDSMVHTQEFNQETRNKASTLLPSLSGFPFIVSLVVTATLLDVTKGLCQKLQTRGAYATCATQVVFYRGVFVYQYALCTICGGGYYLAVIENSMKLGSLNLTCVGA